MAAKITIVLCLQAVLVQYVFCQYVLPGSAASNRVVENVVSNSGLGSASNLASGLGYTNLAGTALGVGSSSASGAALVAPSSLSFAPKGVLAVTSYTSLVPNGLTVLSENTIDGAVTVNGELPFLSAVAFEASLPTSGQGVASCGCGDGNIGITNEGLPNRGLGLNGNGGLGLNGNGGLGLNGNGGLGLNGNGGLGLNGLGRRY